MSPAIIVIRRRRNGRWFREERFRGRQFRCVRCNSVFYEESGILAHLSREDSGQAENPDLPAVGRSVDIRVPYLRDLKEMLGRRRLRTGDE
jgi:hypothetical protein